MTVDTNITPIDLDTEIKELIVELRQADIKDKERIADDLAKLRTMRRNQRDNLTTQRDILTTMRSKMHLVAEIFEKTHRPRVDID